MLSWIEQVVRIFFFLILILRDNYFITKLYHWMKNNFYVLLTEQKPEKDEWGSGLEACQAALDLEKHVNQALLDLHNVADTHGDPQVGQILPYCSLLQ